MMPSLNIIIFLTSAQFGMANMALIVFLSRCLIRLNVCMYAWITQRGSRCFFFIYHQHSLLTCSSSRANKLDYDGWMNGLLNNIVDP